jgi:small-conductance mechanosensitive channel
LVVLLQVGLYGRRLFFELLRLWAQRRDDPPSTLLGALRFAGSFVIWSLILMFGLSAVGIEISALLAGLGVGGVAAALAAQSILGDVFSAVSIYSDRPFDIGDFVSFGEDRGWVTGIGWRTTRLKSLGGELLIVPNSDMSGSRVHNFGRMERRRVAFDIGVVYRTTTEHMKMIPDLIQEVIDQTELATFDRSHFKHFGDFSLNFETVFYVEAKEYGTYMEVQHHVMMGILERLRTEGIEFAFPTRSLYLEGMPAVQVQSPEV